MAKITIDGVGTVEVADGMRLVIALEDNDGDPLHRCGGNAKCTTCRVEFSAGEPDKMTEAEKNRLGDDLGKFRLSCQCLAEGEMSLKVLMPFAESGLDDPGGRPEDHITPDPIWT